jgi:hypothetical protein
MANRNDGNRAISSLGIFGKYSVKHNKKLGIIDVPDVSRAIMVEAEFRSIVMI